MNKILIFFKIILIPVDLLMLLLAAVSAYYLRFQSFLTELRPVIFNISILEIFKISLSLGAVMILIFGLSGLYSFKKINKKEEFSKIVLACSTGLMIILVWMIFFAYEIFGSRFIILAGWVLGIIYVALGRYAIDYIKKQVYKRGVGLSKVVMVGRSAGLNSLKEYFNNNPQLGYRVVAVIDTVNTNIGELLSRMKKKFHLDEIIQMDPDLSKEGRLNLLDFAEQNHLQYKYTADLFETKATNISVETYQGIPIVEIKKTKLEGWGRVIKRIFDIFLSMFLIIIFSPIMLITAVAIKLNSRGPMIFSRLENGDYLKRVGQYGKLFKYFKFRSMRHNAHNLRYSPEYKDKNLRQEGPLVKIKNDPRITTVGKLIRRFSIDELPEFILVLMGRMSLVGPRPHLPEEVEQYKKHHRKVLTIKPGITGMAQISGRSDLNFEDEVRLDSYYIENWSIWLDLYILLKTPWAVFKHRNTE